MSPYLLQMLASADVIVAPFDGSSVVLSFKVADITDARCLAAQFRSAADTLDALPFPRGDEPTPPSAHVFVLPCRSGAAAIAEALGLVGGIEAHLGGDPPSTPPPAPCPADCAFQGEHTHEPTCEGCRAFQPFRRRGGRWLCLDCLSVP